MHLREDIVHLLRRLGVSLAKDAQHAQHLHLQERVDDPMHVVLGLVAREHQVLQRRDEGGRVPAQLLNHVWLDQAHFAHQLERGEQHRMVARTQQRADAVNIRVSELRTLAKDTDRAERCLLGNERVGADHQLLDLMARVRPSAIEGGHLLGS